MIIPCLFSHPRRPRVPDLLQSMLGLFGEKPFMPHRQPRGTINELQWWLHTLSSRPPIPIPHYPHAVDHQAFSDASTSHGLAIIIGNKWRAWRLHSRFRVSNSHSAHSQSIQHATHGLLRQPRSCRWLEERQESKHAHQCHIQEDP